MWYDFYPTSCVFSIPETWRGDRKHITSWIKIVSHHKTWEILFITYLPPNTRFLDFILETAWRRNTQSGVCNYKNKLLAQGLVAVTKLLARDCQVLAQVLCIKKPQNNVKLDLSFSHSSKKCRTLFVWSYFLFFDDIVSSTGTIPWAFELVLLSIVV